MIDVHNSNIKTIKLGDRKFEDIFNTADDQIHFNSVPWSLSNACKIIVDIYLLANEEEKEYNEYSERDVFIKFIAAFWRQTFYQHGCDDKLSYEIGQQNEHFFENSTISKTTTENLYMLPNLLLNESFISRKIQNVYYNLNYFLINQIKESFVKYIFLRENVFEAQLKKIRDKTFYYGIDGTEKYVKESLNSTILSLDFITPLFYQLKQNLTNNFDSGSHQNIRYKQVETVFYANEKQFANYANKNLLNLCTIDPENSDIKKLTDCERIVKNEQDIRRIKKKVLNNARNINDPEYIRDNTQRIFGDILSFNNTAETKYHFENRKDSSETKNKVGGSEVKNDDIERPVEERLREVDNDGKMVRESQTDKLGSVSKSMYTRKYKRSGKGVGVSAARIVIVFAILIQHTDAIEGIIGRLLREALGWGACPGLPRRPCTLALSCWARGGSTAPAETCGPSWLLTCCGPTPEGGLYNQLDEGYREDYTLNNPPQIALYKSDPLDSSGGSWRRTPQIANNVFRRRIDDDYDVESDCGVAGGSDRIIQKRIIGGRAAQLAEFPWQAHIRIGDYQCGGVLVSRWFVATAAHCVQRAHSRDIAVWLGALDTRAQAPPAEKHRVIQKIIHPLFRYRVTQPDRYDLALLMLSRPAILGFNVLPVCLPSSTWATPDRRYRLNQEDSNNFWPSDESLAGRKALVAGWGSTGNGGAPRGTHRLRSAVVPILSTEECVVWHKSKQISVEIHSEMICAGHSDGHQDACLGDSGGPLVVPKDGRYYLVGITSAGFGCGVDHQPGIYHNVLVTSHWIRHMIRR